MYNDNEYETQRKQINFYPLRKRELENKMREMAAATDNTVDTANAVVQHSNE